MVTLRLKKRYGPVDLTTIENFVSQFFAHKNVIVSVTKRMEKETKINISLKS